MSQIDREMKPIRRSGGPGTPFFSVATLAAPHHGALTARPLSEPWLPRAWSGLHAALEALSRSDDGRTRNPCT